MTKEKCIALLNRYAEYNGIGIPELAGCREAMRTAAELLQRPALPSNLDEAAKEYMRNYIPFDQCDSRDIRCAFKAGAEWMAGQGVAKEAVIGMATEEISINVSQETLDELDLCPGDKVVVQIRKIL